MLGQEGTGEAVLDSAASADLERGGAAEVGFQRMRGAPGGLCVWSGVHDGHVGAEVWRPLSKQRRAGQAGMLDGKS